MVGKENSILDNLSWLRFAWAIPCDKDCISILNLSNWLFTNKTVVLFSLGIKPITLSGKQAFIFKIAVSAIFAAIVIHKVFSFQSLLCFKPASE